MSYSELLLKHGKTYGVSMERFDLSLSQMSELVEKIEVAIKKHEDFDIINIKDSLETFNNTVRSCEALIEKNDLSCRVYTEYRSASVTSSFWGPTFLIGVASSLAIGAHNVATWNPDYEIGKNYLTRSLSIRWKKK
ncbi:hypothetical protein [Klebsiella aerogenes]|uniref:hypothetical protein n=1 Tax=Klebsiella aerogenes TaxID=548 RepID=UPI00351CEE98